jgi:hypothetical protein
MERKTRYLEKAANNKQYGKLGFALKFVMHVLPVLYSDGKMNMHCYSAGVF